MLEGISVPGHAHRLQAEHLEDAFVCDGCNERGTGLRYRCRRCNYDMHNFCATASPSVPHPLSAAKMELFPSPVERENPWCCACDKSVSGLNYYCRASGDVLHPCCARLFQETLTHGADTLRLCQNLSADPCATCGQRKRGWAYVCTNYSVHVHCLIQEIETPESLEFNISGNHACPQLCSGGLEYTEESGTSDHYYSEPAQNARGRSGTVSTYKSKNGFKRFCRNIKLLAKALRSYLLGRPSTARIDFATYA